MWRSDVLPFYLSNFPTLLRKFLSTSQPTHIMMTETLLRWEERWGWFGLLVRVLSPQFRRESGHLHQVPSLVLSFTFTLSSRRFTLSLSFLVSYLGTLTTRSEAGVDDLRVDGKLRVEVDGKTFGGCRRLKLPLENWGNVV